MPASTKVNFGGSCQVNGPNSDQVIEATPRYVTGLTRSGTRYVYRKSSATNRFWRLEFAFITDSQKSALQSFFTSTANGPSSTFTYTHTTGTSYTVRFADMALNWRRIGPNQWGLSVTLELTSEVNG